MISKFLESDLKEVEDYLAGHAKPGMAEAVKNAREKLSEAREAAEIILEGDYISWGENVGLAKSDALKIMASWYGEEASKIISWLGVST